MINNEAHPAPDGCPFILDVIKQEFTLIIDGEHLPPMDKSTFYAYFPNEDYRFGVFVPIKHLVYSGYIHKKDYYYKLYYN